jgi:hypothetical protein
MADTVDMQTTCTPLKRLLTGLCSNFHLLVQQQPHLLQGLLMWSWAAAVGRLPQQVQLQGELLHELAEALGEILYSYGGSVCSSSSSSSSEACITLHASAQQELSCCSRQAAAAAAAAGRAAARAC